MTDVEDPTEQNRQSPDHTERLLRLEEGDVTSARDASEMGEEEEDDDDMSVLSQGQEEAKGDDLNRNDQPNDDLSNEDREMIEKCLKFGESALHNACRAGAKLEVIKYLGEKVEKGREALLKADRDGRYPLHLACARGASLEVIKYLVEEVDSKKGREALLKADEYGWYPLHLACYAGASLEVIKYLVEEADTEKGREALPKADDYGQYPLHLACRGGAKLDVIKYLVEVADIDKGREALLKADVYGQYPLHLACAGGAELEVIKYLVEEEDSEKGREALLKADGYGMYPLHRACEGGAELEVIKYLVEEADSEKGREALLKADEYGKYPLHLACRSALYSRALNTEDSRDCLIAQYLANKNPATLKKRDGNGLTPLQYLRDNQLRYLVPDTHQTGGVADKPSDIDRLNYLLYAQALAYAARQAELPGMSLCVGLYGRWGGGKSTLWKQVKKCLHSEFLMEDVQILYNAKNFDLGNLSLEKGKKKLRREVARAADAAVEPFDAAAERLKSDAYVPLMYKELWAEEKTAQTPTLLEKLIFCFLWLFECCLFTSQHDVFQRALENERDDKRAKEMHRTIQDAHCRSDERVAFAFVFLVLIPFSPIWLILWLLLMLYKRVFSCECSMQMKNKALISRAEHIRGIILGDTPLGNGDAVQWRAAPAGTFLVIISLQLVRAVLGGVILLLKAMQYICCFRCCCNRSDYTPTGATDYKIVQFNAWAYQGSDLLWASLMKQLWDAVEARYGKDAVRYHRASIALAGESPSEQTSQSLSPEDRARQRKRALLMFRVRSVFSAFLFFLILAVTLALTITKCTGVEKCFKSVSNATDTASENVEEGENKAGLIAAIVASITAFFPFLAQVITFTNKVLPYIRRTRGEYIFDKAAAASKRKDFTEELGFMGEVKAEVDYLFDLLRTETFLDKDVGCQRYLRLCVFIDDLDRCPEDIVVSVLEAVILLLVDGPISVWMAIDSRIVVQCIEAVKGGVAEKAEISGHEFLDKIVQLPFSLPSLPDSAKISYLNKIVEAKELEPSRVLARFLRTSTAYKQTKRMKELNSKINRLTSEGSAITKLVPIAHAMKETDLIVNQPDREAIIGMSESELIKQMGDGAENISAEQAENFCSIIAEANSRLISELLESGAVIGAPSRSTPRTGPSSSHVSMCRDVHQSLSTSSARHEVNDTIDDEQLPDESIGIWPPPKNIYIPMLSEKERTSLEAFVPFIDGNPRRLKRIINVFNVARRIAELKAGPSNPILSQLTPKILKFVILLEQWPCRMAWILQFLEDAEQMCIYNVVDERIQVLLKAKFNEFRTPWFQSAWIWDALWFRTPSTSQSIWDVLCTIDILKLYKKVLHDLMCRVNAEDVLTIDSDPQLFEGLLLKEVNEETIIVQDLKLLRRNMDIDEQAKLLRQYAFNMPVAITEKVGRLLNKSLANG